MNVTKIVKSLLANSEDEYKKLVSSNVDWIARSSEDVLALRNSKDHPLAKLSKNEFNEFLSSLSYGNGGISGGSYRPLLKSLTIKETFEVFASFGIPGVLDRR